MTAIFAPAPGTSHPRASILNARCSTRSSTKFVLPRRKKCHLNPPPSPAGVDIYPSPYVRLVLSPLITSPERKAFAENSSETLDPPAKMVLTEYTHIFAIGTIFALLEAYNNGASMFSPGTWPPRTCD